MRKGEIKTLVEDKQHYAFIRRVLLKLEFNGRQIHKIEGPANATLGRSFVIKTFPVELRAHRKARQGGKLTSNRLIVCLDADDGTVDDAISELRDAAKRENTPMPDVGEGVVLLIPRNEIETWLEYLSGSRVTEEKDDCRKRKGHESEIATEVTQFVEYVKNPISIPTNAPPSMIRAIGEIRRELLDGV